MVLEVIKDRFSVRNFADKEVPDTVINSILEAGRLAPSWVNTQPWHFIVVKNQETKNLLSQLSHGQPQVAQAPVVLVCCGDLGTWDRENYRKIVESRPGITQERVNSLLSNQGFTPKLSSEDIVLLRTVEELTYAVAYMTLEVQNQGIGASIIGFFGNDITRTVPDVYQKVREKLALPGNIMPIILLPIGYPAPDVERPLKRRKAPEDIISYEKYNNR